MYTYIIYIAYHYRYYYTTVPAVRAPCERQFIYMPVVYRRYFKRHHIVYDASNIVFLRTGSCMYHRICVGLFSQGKNCFNTDNIKYYTIVFDTYRKLLLFSKLYIEMLYAYDKIFFFLFCTSENITARFSKYKMNVDSRFRNERIRYQSSGASD